MALHTTAAEEEFFLMGTAQDLYDRLVELYNTIGFGAMPAHHLRRLLEAIIDKDEARTLLAMPPGVFLDASQVAETLGEEKALVADRLETMTNKGLLYCRSGEARQYRLLQLLPGVFELQFMRGDRREGDEELARLFEEVLHAPPDGKEAPDITPFARVIPVHAQIDPSIEVFTYEQVAHYIDTAKDICLTTCYCRHQKELIGKACSAPKDVCMQFGPFAQFIIERKFGRRITKEEAKETIGRAVRHGLVLTSTNAKKHIDFICACCGCCCGILTSVKNAHMPSMAAASNFLLRIDVEACTGCGACVEACHMEALSLAADVVTVDQGRCIGCGVCTMQCPSDALAMVRKPESREPPATYKELQGMITQDMLRHRSGPPAAKG
jgi:electron transport complex protein RnfB